MPSLPRCPPTELVIAASAAARAAHDHSGCLRSRRGVAIWQPDSGHLTLGTNTPSPAIVCDGTDACKAVCGRICIHAEQMALLRCKNAEGAEMVHVKVDGKGQMVPSGPPSCDQCSKLILHAGIAGMWLLHEDGWKRCTALEFHEATLKNCGLKFEVAPQPM